MVLVLVEVLRDWGVVEVQVPWEHLQGDIQVMNEMNKAQFLAVWCILSCF